MCTFCNISGNFNGTPEANSCICKEKYELSGSSCIDICGDGFLVNSSASACDDGNLVDGDGCSSICETETDYLCDSGSSTSASTCSYRGTPIVFQLTRTERTDGQNQGVFTFTVFPSLLLMYGVDLSQAVVFECNSTHTISGLSY